MSAEAIDVGTAMRVTGVLNRLTAEARDERDGLREAIREALSYLASQDWDGPCPPARAVLEAALVR